MIFSNAQVSGFVALAALALAVIPARAEPAKLDTLCQGMVDKAGNPWPVKQIVQCAPWRKQRQADLDGSITQCKAAHVNDNNDGAFDPCEIQEEASTRFWERAQELDAQNPNHVVQELPNPILPPAQRPLEAPDAQTHVPQ